MESMYANQVWTLVNPPKGVKPIRCKLGFQEENRRGWKCADL